MNDYLKPYDNKFSFNNKIKRLAWNVWFVLFYRPLNLPVFNDFRIFILQCFGAKIGKGCNIRSTAKIWAPWNLEVGDFVAIGPNAIIYNPGVIKLENKVTISQYAHLCSATHDYTKIENPLITAPITIEDLVWVAAEAFVGPGVKLGKGSIVAARAVVVKNVEPWTVVGGNPAKFIKERKIEN